jgi:nucleoside-diphosphate-sugar epimerase
VEAVKADLGDPATLPAAVSGADVIVHFAGRLFAPRPERFLPETNTRWFSNLLAAALQAQVGRVILISFPHVEGPTLFDRPATGRLDRDPISVHARTRLEEERLLMERTRNTATTPVVLRLGMIYGRGILMIEAARWLARRRLLCVWRQPTVFQLLSTADYLAAAEAAIFRPGGRNLPCGRRTTRHDSAIPRRSLSRGLPPADSCRLRLSTWQQDCASCSRG